MSRLETIAAADLLAVLADFGESVTCQPLDGPARTISAYVEYAREADILLVSVLEITNEHIWATFTNDETNATYGGVAAPASGLILRRAADSVEHAWSFSPQVEEIPGGWRVLFTRRRLYRVGPHQ